MAVFAALSAWMAVASQGFLEADGITHYLSRRFALSQPLHIVGVWTRPVCVLLYCLPAYFGGLVATRLTSLVLVLMMAVLTVDVARRLGFRRPEFAGLLLLTQPLLFAHSFSELTEIPFALLLLAMFAAYQRRWFAVLAAIASVMPAARPEGFGLLAIVAVALVAHRRFVWLPILPMGVAAWSYAGWRLFDSTEWYPWWQWLRMNWPYSPQSVYGSGRPYYFLAILPAVVGPVAFPLVWVGAWACLGDCRGVPSRSRVVAWVTTLAGDHGRRCEALIAAIPLGVLVGHSVLWTLGRMASNGEPRYMLIVAPFWALLAAAGWRRLHAVLPALTPGRLALAAAAVPVAANLAYPAFPLKAQAHDRLAIRVTEALRDEGESLHRRYPRITSSLPHLYMRLDLDRLDDTRVADPSQRTALDPPRGVQYLWDDIYSTHNSNELYCVTEKMLTDHGWVPSKTFIEENRRLILFLSPLDVDGRPSIPPSTADAPATTP